MKNVAVVPLASPAELNEQKQHSAQRLNELIVNNVLTLIRNTFFVHIIESLNAVPKSFPLTRKINKSFQESGNSRIFDS